MVGFLASCPTMEVVKVVKPKAIRTTTTTTQATTAAANNKRNAKQNRRRKQQQQQCNNRSHEMLIRKNSRRKEPCGLSLAVPTTTSVAAPAIAAVDKK